MRYGYNSGGVHKVSVEGRKAPTPAYSRWNTMMQRCYNPNDDSYHKYGGSGVTVHESWHDFQVFAQWYADNMKDGWHMDKDLFGGVQYGPDSVVAVPEPINQHIRNFNQPRYYAVRKSTLTYYCHAVNAYGVRKAYGKFKTRDDAHDFYQGFIRDKMAILVGRYDLPVKVRDKLLSL